jgi:hypothetical protein
MTMKKGAAIFLVSCGTVLSLASAAVAQEKGDSGVTMGYPVAFGFVYHVTDRVALRPEVTLSRGSSDIEQPIGSSESTNWAVGVGLSGLFYVGEWDRVRAYVSPRYSYSRAESTSSIFLVDEQISTATTNSHLFSGSFGAQYSPHPRFSVFGEIGLGYSVQNIESGFTPTRSETWTLSIRTGAGIVFYF